MDIEAIKRLCSAVILIAAKDYHANKEQRASIMRFINSTWGADIIDCSDYPNMTPELFKDIAENEKIRRYAAGWDRVEEKRIRRGTYKKRGSKNE